MAAKREKRNWFVEDESIFSLKPYVARGWYPTGPAIHVSLTFERTNRFYAFGVANGKKEHFYFYSNKKKKTKNNKKKHRNIDSKMTLNFVKRVHKRYPKLLLIWDKAPNHKTRTVQAYIHEHQIKQIWFPTACPELNPMEPAWNTLKTATANTHYPAITDYKNAVKKHTNKKNLTKMFKYICT